MPELDVLCSTNQIIDIRWFCVRGLVHSTTEKKINRSVELKPKIAARLVRLLLRFFCSCASVDWHLSMNGQKAVHQSNRAECNFSFDIPTEIRN